MEAGRLFQVSKISEILKKILTYSLVLVVSVLVGRVCALNSFAPFGAAFICAISISKKEWYFPACFGVILGSVLLIENQMWYYMCVNGLTALFLLIPQNIKKIPEHAGAFASLLLASVLASIIIASKTPLNYMVRAFELIFCCAFVFIFETAIKITTLKKEFIIKEEQIIALCFISLIIVLGFGGITVLGITVCNVVAILFALVFAYLGGPGLGSACGLALGCACALASSNSLFLIGNLGICALGGGVLKRINKFALVFGFILINAIITYLFTSGQQAIMPLLDNLCAGAIFLLLPNSFLSFIERYVDTDNSREYRQEKHWANIRGEITDKLNKVSVVCENISTMFNIDLEEENEKDVIVRLAQDNCSQCALKKTCWDSEFANTFAVFNNLYKNYQNGSLEKTQFNNEFSKRCQRQSLLLNNAKLTFSEQELKEQWQAKINAAKQITAQQMREVSDIMEILAKNVEQNIYDAETDKFEIKPKFKIISGCESRSIENVCGDVFKLKKLGNNRLLAILCDGMGHGETAHAAAKESVSLIESFFAAGYDKKNILTTINRLLVLNNDDEMYTTVDMCAIDLVTGRSEFTKIGAERTFLLRNNELMCMSAPALPMGILEDFKPAVFRKQLYDGDIIIMLTDGVGDIIGDDVAEWLLDILADPDTPSKMAGEILDKAALAGARDDMTILILKVERVTESE